jgi:hypothetical protein
MSGEGCLPNDPAAATMPCASAPAAPHNALPADATHCIGTPSPGVFASGDFLSPLARGVDGARCANPNVND